MNGIINIYKEKGYTSHDVVAKMRGILKMKKIGHTGTLDPNAEGVLPVCIGRGTKLVDLITDKDKTYETVLKLGIVTDTQDMTGTILSTAEVTTNFEEIKKVIESYVGEYDQLPPMYSAIKVNGKKLYELAREGKEIERKTRRVTIYGIKILDYIPEKHEVRLSVDCSKGTYIRTLLHDIGASLGCGGAMKELLRTKVGDFHIENALTLAQVAQLVQDNQIADYIIEVDQYFHQNRKIHMKEEHDKYVHNGNAIPKEILGTYLDHDTMDMLREQKSCNHGIKTENLSENNKEMNQQYPDIESLIRIYDSQDAFIGVYSYDNAKESLKPVKMFFEKQN